MALRLWFWLRGFGLGLGTQVYVSSFLVPCALFIDSCTDPGLDFGPDLGPGQGFSLGLGLGLGMRTWRIPGTSISSVSTLIRIGMSSRVGLGFEFTLR